MEYQTVGMCNSFADCLTITLKYHCTMLHPTPLVHTCQVSVSKSHNSLGPAELAPPAKSPAPNCYAQLVRVMLHTTVYKRLCVRTYVIDWWMDGWIDGWYNTPTVTVTMSHAFSLSFFFLGSFSFHALLGEAWLEATPQGYCTCWPRVAVCCRLFHWSKYKDTDNSSEHLRNVWTCSTAVGSFQEDDNGPKMEKHHRLGGKLCWVDSVLRFSFNMFSLSLCLSLSPSLFV